MIRPIATIGDPVLSEMAREVTLDELRSPEIQAVIDDLVATLKSTSGVGLAAPQISESLRIVIVDKPLTVLVNPVVTPIGEHMDVSTEGCLSVPGVTGEVRRHQAVRVQALDRKGKPIDAIWVKFRAIVVQHEVDHLDGILYVQRAGGMRQDAAARRASDPQPIEATQGPGGKKTYVIESPAPVSGRQFVTFRFEGAGRLVDLRLQPAQAIVSGVWLSGSALQQRGFPASSAKNLLLGERGLPIVAQDSLRVELRVPAGRPRKIVAEADVDP